MTEVKAAGSPAPDQPKTSTPTDPGSPYAEYGFGPRIKRHTTWQPERWEAVGDPTLAGLPPASRETKRFHTWLDRGIESLAFAHFVAKTFARGSGGPHGGHILVLAGPTGVGKTHLALACGWEWFDDGMSVYFARVDDLLDELRRGLGDETYHQKLEYFKTCDLLVLDDLGAEHSRDWAEEKLDRIIDWRYVNREAMVVTTNARREDLAPRIASRLADHRASLVVQLDASDYRSGAQ